MTMPAARVGDDVAHVRGRGAILTGSADVLIGNVPAARQGDLVQHNSGTEPVKQGERTVLINGLPAARVGDKVGCGGAIALGCNNVFIGRDADEDCLREAAREGAMLVEPSDAVGDDEAEP